MRFCVCTAHTCNPPQNSYQSLLKKNSDDFGSTQKKRKKIASSINFIEGDFSSVSSAKKAAAAIRDEAPHFKAFIHNAGVWPVKLEYSAGGLEQSFAVNHLAPFILNALLEDLFIKNKGTSKNCFKGCSLVGTVYR